MKIHRMIIFSVFLMALSAQAEVKTKYKYNQIILNKFAKSLLKNQSYLQKKNVSLSIEVRFDKFAKVYDKKTIKCLADLKCISSTDIPISSHLKSIKLVSSSYFFQKDISVWTQQLTKYFQIPVKVKPASFPLFWVLLLCLGMILSGGLSLLTYKLLRKKEKRLASPSLAVAPKSVISKVPEPILFDHDIKKQIMEELNQTLSMADYIDDEASETEKKDIEVLINENTQLSKDLEGIYHLWHSSIDEHLRLKKQLEFSDRLPENLAKRIISNSKDNASIAKTKEILPEPEQIEPLEIQDQDLPL